MNVCGLREPGEQDFVNLRNLKKSRIESRVSFLRRFVNLGNVSFRLLQARTSAAGEERARVLHQILLAMAAIFVFPEEPCCK